MTPAERLALKHDLIDGAEAAMKVLWRFEDATGVKIDPEKTQVLDGFFRVMRKYGLDVDAAIDAVLNKPAAE